MREFFQKGNPKEKILLFSFSKPVTMRPSLGIITRIDWQKFDFTYISLSEEGYTQAFLVNRQGEDSLAAYYAGAQGRQRAWCLLGLLSSQRLRSISYLVTVVFVVEALGLNIPHRIRLLHLYIHVATACYSAKSRCSSSSYAVITLL